MKFFKKHRKYFFISMICTFFVLALITGFIWVEKNTRATTLGDRSPFFSYKFEGYKIKFVQFHFMGKDFVFNF